MKLSAKIGAIEIGEDAVRIAVVKTGGRLPKVLETAEAPVASSEQPEGLRAAQVEAVQQAVAALNTPPSVYVLALPMSWAIIRILTVPFRGKRKIAAAAPFELEPFLAIPIEELAVDFLPTRTIQNNTEVLAVGIRRATLDEHTDILDQAAFAVDGAILDATALTGLWLATQQDTSGTYGVLHIREQETILAILENKKLTYLRRIDSSTQALRANPEAFAREVSNAIRAYSADLQDGDPLRTLDITGIALSDHEREIIEQILELPITNEDLTTSIPGFGSVVPTDRESDTLPDPENRWTTLIATAGSASGGPFYLNFLRRQFASRKTLKTLVDFGIAICLLGVVILLGLIGAIYTDYRNNLADIDRIGEAVWQEFATTFPDAAIERPLGDIGGFKSLEMMQLAADDERESSGTLSPDMFDRPTLLDIMREIGRYLPDDVAAIREIRVSVSKNMTITIYGEVNQPGKFNESIESLRQASVFIVREPQRTSDLGKETFTLTATL